MSGLQMLSRTSSCSSRACRLVALVSGTTTGFTAAKLVYVGASDDTIHFIIQQSLSGTTGFTAAMLVDVGISVSITHSSSSRCPGRHSYAKISTTLQHHEETQEHERLTAQK